MASIRDRAADALRAAMRERDTDATSAYRTLLSACSNAEAVASTARAGAIEEAGAVGSHAVEAARRTLTDDDVRLITITEREELQVAAADARTRGDAASAEHLDRQAALLDALLR